MIDQIKNFLADVENDKAFWAKNGSVYRNLRELGKGLSSDRTVFMSHVTPARNDFASWVLNVIKDEDLARDMEMTKDYQRTVQLINDRVDHFDKIMFNYYFGSINDMILNSDLDRNNYLKMAGVDPVDYPKETHLNFSTELKEVPETKVAPEEPEIEINEATMNDYISQMRKINDEIKTALQDKQTRNPIESIMERVRNQSIFTVIKDLFKRK